MQVEQSKVEKITITDKKGLDPIHVYLEDTAKNQGRITIVCYGCALNAYWSSMGKGIKEFFAYASVDYISNIFKNNIRDSYDVENFKITEYKGRMLENRVNASCRMSREQEAYIERIIECVQEALKEVLSE